MKSQILAFVFVAGTLGVTAADVQPTNVVVRASSAEPSTATGPKINFDTNTCDFGKVDAGKVVKHEFLFTNTGNEVLEIKDVRPGCGCTTAGAWDKKVEPGKTGKIPLQFNTAGYSSVFAKTVTVNCNDPAKPNVVLYLKGTVWKPIEVTPPNAIFSFGPDVQTNTVEKRILRIVNQLEEAVTIEEPKITHPAFKAELKTVRVGKEFELTVSAIAPLGGSSASAPITLQTSSPRVPALKINALATVPPVVSVVPAQIRLPSGPLSNAVQVVVALQNNSSNSLAFTDPAINAQGVDLDLKEVQPGRRFDLTALFPAGFSIQPGQKIELKVNTTRKSLPVVTVPVFQPPTPAVAPSPAPVHAAATSPVGPTVGQVVPLASSAAGGFHK